jgi:nitrite reductase (cytochrome c-552)
MAVRASWIITSVLALSAVGAYAAVQLMDADSSKYAGEFKNQYETWKQTAESQDVVDVLAEDPNLVVLWAGYGFAKDYNKARGHAYSIEDIRNTLRTGAPTGPDDGPMPMACWSCKTPDVGRYIVEKGEKDYFTGKWSRLGGEMHHEIGCGNCHEADGGLAISTPFTDRGMVAIGWKWADASRSQKQSMVCAQCHVEYYFTADKFVKFPWDMGTTVDEIETYYDAINFADWTHALSKAPMLKAQHPGFETFMRGTHGRNGVSCANCHMPRVQAADGKKFTSHNIGNPFDNYEASCGRCHDQSKEDMEGVVAKYKGMVNEAKMNAERQLVHAHYEAAAAWKAGASEAEMADALKAIRHAQWRWDFAIASHGVHMHNPTEALQILASSLDRAAEARVLLARVLATHGQTAAIAIPDISTKAAAQAAVGLDAAKLKADKAKFLETLAPEWDKAYKAAHGGN